MTFYVYIHKKQTDGTPFYVGRGSGRRAFIKSNRSTWWKNIVNKHGFFVEICQEGMIESDAFLLEMWLIAKLRNDGFELCNITDGGEGIRGHETVKGLKIQCSNGMSFRSARKAADWVSKNTSYKASGWGICLCARGKSSTAYGFSWWIDGDNQKEYVSRYELSSNSNKKLVYSSLGEVFHGINQATEFLKENGYPKASGSGIGERAKNGGSLYGRCWSFISFPKHPIVTGREASNRKNHTKKNYEDE